MEWNGEPSVTEGYKATCRPILRLRELTKEHEVNSIWALVLAVLVSLCVAWGCSERRGPKTQGDESPRSTELPEGRS